MSRETAHRTQPHLVSLTIPVYRGEKTLPGLVEEIVPMLSTFRTPAGHLARVSEIVLVHDHGPDGSARIIGELADRLDVVHPVWLSRNFGQHAATLAGMAASSGDWIVTMDEDGQHNPADLPRMLDVAMAQGAALVYAKPARLRHNVVRNAGSKGAKRLVDTLVAGSAASTYHSYRLVLGEIGRSVAAYSGAGVYLDVALGWVVSRVATCSVELREEGVRPSGYRLRTLVSHFLRMALTTGTRVLRVVSYAGAVLALLGFFLAGYLVVNRLAGEAVVQGWTSVMVVILMASGAVLFTLGVVAEYLGVAVNMALGKPLYLAVSDPRDSALARPVERLEQPVDQTRPS